MDPKLTDFDISTLNTLLTALGSYQVDLQNSIEIADKYNLSHDAHSQELERVHLLVTQTIAAKAKLIAEEIVNSN